MPKKWTDKKWPLKSGKKDERNFKLKTLGNLAIINSKLNSSIRDADWETKKSGRGRTQGLEYYSAGIETLAPFLKLREWNEQKIEKRAKFLYEKAFKIWDLDDE